MAEHLWRTVKCTLGFGNVYDGSICWFSRKFWDVHDYHKSKGGDGIPSHLYTYTCFHCGAEFCI